MRHFAPPSPVHVARARARARAHHQFRLARFARLARFPRLAALTPLGILLAILLASPAAGADEFRSRFGTSGWTFGGGGYLSIAYRYIQKPDNYDLAGRNGGFQLEQARVGVDVQYESVLAARVSFEGASEDRVSQSFPGGQLSVRLRDAYITWAPARALRITVGQTVTPWDLDSMRSSAELPFVSRALPIEGVQPHEGRALRGLGTDRTLGLSIHSGDIPIGATSSLRYALLVGNGTGQNQLLNDNNLPAVFGRIEYAWWGAQELPADRVAPMRGPLDGKRRPVVNLGLAGQYNPRTGGNPPDLIDETDVGAAFDLALALRGVELQGGILYLRTIFDTVSAAPDLERFGWWAHLRFTIPRLPFDLTPGYRIASYAPRAHLTTSAPSDGDAQIDSDLSLLYHTFGITVRPSQRLPIRLIADYTVTSERGPNVLANDRFEAAVVGIF